MKVLGMKLGHSVEISDLRLAFRNDSYVYGWKIRFKCVVSNLTREFCGKGFDIYRRRPV